MYKFIIILCLFVSSIQAQQVDPTKPFTFSSANKTNKKISKFVLQSIIKQDGKFIAIINNKSMKVGDKVGKYQLTEVATKHVTLRAYDKSLKLALFNNIVARPHSK